ncbi:MAG: helix-turn-helix domain-containing protein [Acutalibacteraceae bacterium]
MKNNFNFEIGERVRRARTAQGLSREQLSEMLEISSLFLGYIECGQRGMSLTTLGKLCMTLHVSADYILFGKESNASDKEVLLEAISGIDEKYLPLALENINSFKRILALVKSESTKNSENKKPGCSD